MEIISFRFQDFLSAFIILFAVIDITGLTPISSRYFFVCHCRRAGYLRDGHRDVARGGDFQE